MGRPRKDSSLGLPTRVYPKGSSYWYVHRDNRWENLGPDLARAKKAGEAYNAGSSIPGTMGWWLDKFIEWQEGLRCTGSEGALSDRTMKDYRTAIGYLKPYLGDMAPENIGSHHVQEYLDIGIVANRSVQANREKAMLSSCLTWMVRRNHAGLAWNVCLAVPANSERVRGRYVTDAEYMTVYDGAPLPVRLWMELIYRTLQRPSDILTWSSENFVALEDQSVLSFKQSKTGRPMKIALSERLHDCLYEFSLARMLQKRPVANHYVICGRDGSPYTYGGLSSMFRRHVKACGVRDFTLYDCKAKGATDMYQGGKPIEQISELCGHESIAQTERYIKRRLEIIIKPNDRSMN